MLKICLPDRSDFLGSNFSAKIAVYMYAKSKNYEIYCNEKISYHDSMYMRPFLNDSKVNNNKEDVKCIDEATKEGNIRLLNGKTVQNLKCDLLSHFKKHYKSKFYNEIKHIANERGYKLPWENNKNIICIHIRLYDDHWHEGANNSDYDGSYSANYIKKFIEEDNIDLFDKRVMYRVCKEKGFKIPPGSEASLCDRQAAININKLESIIKQLKEGYPSKEIHVVTKLSKNEKNQKYIDLCDKYNIKIHSNKDYDYDVWLMIHSEILVLSKSTYSLMAGYLHQGSNVYYPLWGIFASTGLYTKYDKSRWSYYI